MFDSRTREQIVEERAIDRWNRIIKRDFSAAYEYISPGSRETTPKKVYIGRFGGATQWLEAVPVKTECEKDLCQVVVSVKYRIRHKFFPKGIENSRDFKENWIHGDGQWWYLLEK